MFRTVEEAEMARDKKRLRDLDPKSRAKAVKGGSGSNLANIGGPVPVRIRNVAGITGVPAQDVKRIRRGGI